MLREADERYGTWHLQQDAQPLSVKVSGPMSTNDDETALLWALDGHGILQRSLWDVAPLLASADIYLLHATQSELSARIRALSEFLPAWFGRSENQAGA